MLFKILERFLELRYLSPYQCIISTSLIILCERRLKVRASKKKIIELETENEMGTGKNEVVEATAVQVLEVDTVTEMIEAMIERH